MQPFTFIHAADLHLDAVLPAPAADLGEAGRHLLSGAVFSALERLVGLCIAEKAAFLLLAGDVFHAGAGSLKANFALSDAFKKLGEHGIEVFWARGNHDSEGDSEAAMPWPENVHIFSPAGERFSALGGEVTLHGASHKTRHERANLSEKLQGGGPGFNIGVLHCAVHGAQGAHASYAPCVLSDLTGAGKDYWALGHVHGASVLAENPPVVYTGSLQGLHVNESGPHGCFVVTVNKSGKAAARFAPIAPVRWEKLALDIGSAANHEELEELALETLRNFCGDLAAQDAGAEFALVRLELCGRSALDAKLRAAGSAAGLAERLNAGLAGLEGSLGVAARVKDVLVSTSPDLDLEALKTSDNLAGATLRLADEVAARLDALAAAGHGSLGDLEEALRTEDWGAELLAALGELYGDRRLEDARALPAPGELGDMAREAAALCLHMFEVDK